MRANLFLAASLVLQPASLFGQTPARPVRNDPAHTVRLGLLTVALPPPEGFEEAASRVAWVKKLFSDTEDPNNEVLAAHVPAETLRLMERGERPAVTFYTKVSVYRSLSEKDFSAAEFAALVSAFEKRVVGLLDADSPVVREQVKAIEKALNELGRAETKFDIPEQQFLGAFEKSANVYSAALLAKTKVQQTGAEPVEGMLVGGLSLVLVKRRVISVYTYREFKSSADIEQLKDFTRKWTSRIVAANR